MDSDAALQADEAGDGQDQDSSIITDETLKDEEAPHGANQPTPETPRLPREGSFPEPSTEPQKELAKKEARSSLVVGCDGSSPITPTPASLDEEKPEPRAQEQTDAPTSDLRVATDLQKELDEVAKLKLVTHSKPPKGHTLLEEQDPPAPVQLNDVTLDNFEKRYLHWLKGNPNSRTTSPLDVVMDIPRSPRTASATANP